MRISLVGATGFIGSRLLNELIRRGHEVVAIARGADKLPDNAIIHPVPIEVTDVAALTRAFRGSDAVIHALATPKDLATEERMARMRAGTAAIISAVKAAGVPRVLAVGGAGTLEVAPGLRFMDSFIFPKAWQGSAIVTAEIKELLKGETVFSWTYLCPPQFLERGERTGKFRLGTDQIVVAEDSFGRSHISVEDYAVAMIDELEQPKHTGRRFTVGY